MALGLNRSIIAKFDFKTERQYFFQLSHHVPFNGSETELAEEIKVYWTNFLRPCDDFHRMEIVHCKNFIHRYI